MAKTDRSKQQEPTPTPTPAQTPAPAAEGTNIAFNPLAEAVDEKSYSGQGAQPGDTSIPDIPEPTFTAPPPEMASTPVAEGSKTQAKKEQPAANPGLTNAPEAEKSESAEHMMNFLWSLMERGYSGLNNMMKISEKRINKEERAGNIDTSIQVSYKGGMATIRDMFNDMNAQADGLLKVEPEFKEEMHPLLVAELSKAGHGMTPRQRIAFGFAAKIASDTVIAYQFLASRKEAFAFARDMKTITAQGGGYDHKETPAPAPAASAGQQASAEETTQQNGEAESQQQIHQQQPGVTLQDAALAKFLPGGVNNRPPSSRKPIRVHPDDKKALKGSTKKKSANTGKAEQYIKAGKAAVSNDPVPGPRVKKGPGRPKGAKNKR